MTAVFCTSAPAFAAAGTGVPWVDGIGIQPFDSRAELTREQVTDQHFKKGRQLYEQARAYESRAQDAGTDGKRTRLLERAFRRYRASAESYAASARRLEEDGREVDYLPQLYSEMGDALYKTRQHDRASHAYSRATEVAPAFLNGHYGLARSGLARGALEVVQDEFSWLVREAETRAEAWSRVDALVELINAWRDSNTDQTENATGFLVWFDQQQTALADTVRWTLLE
ncbi:MAG: hypothetical protein AAF610_07135 [Pseudomonadota bacterium]